MHAACIYNAEWSCYIIFPGPCLSMSVAPWSNFYMTAVFRRLGSHIGLIYIYYACICLWGDDSNRQLLSTCGIHIMHACINARHACARSYLCDGMAILIGLQVISNLWKYLRELDILHINGVGLIKMQLHACMHICILLAKETSWIQCGGLWHRLWSEYKDECSWFPPISWLFVLFSGIYT